MHRSRLAGIATWAAVVLAVCACGPAAGLIVPPTQDSSDSTTAPGRPGTAALLAQMGGYPCPESDFTCVALSVPLDHFAGPPAGETIEVVFAVLPAGGARRGIFVTATGGPGYSGLASADAYTAALDPRIPEHFDVVFFDQRGLAASGGLQCARAATAYYEAGGQAETPEQEAATVAAAQAFARDCVQETGAAEILPYLGTRQAVEDLEAFRQAMGDESIWLYGESYGTQFAQTYAAVHPEHLAGLILDGTVDLTLSGTDYYREQAQAFNDVLVATCRACDADPDCAADAGGDLLAVYDALAARLAHSALDFSFPLPESRTAERRFTLVDLESGADYLYSEDERMLFQRALAAASRGDLVPLARLAYSAQGLDPETLEPVVDPAWSDAVFYAVECSDYAYFSGSPAERAAAYVRAGDAVDAAVPRLGSVFYSDLPCAFWPAQGDPRPAPLVAEGIPTLVLGATADPATPVGNGERVYGRLADGYLITVEGGAHVVFGRGDACPDDVVTAFLVDGERPAQRELHCAGTIASAYVPLPPPDAAAFADVLEAMISVDDEMYYLPEYYYWDYVTPTAVGCPYGGTLSFEATDEGESYTLEGCAFSAGFTMTGSGTYSYDEDLFTLRVDVTGLAEGRLTYTRDGGGDLHVRGQYASRPVDLSE